MSEGQVASGHSASDCANQQPEVLAGYKHTDVGVIPEDWQSTTVREVAPLQRGFDLPTSRIRTGPHPVVYSNGALRHHNRAMVKGPGVVTGRSGTIGKVHFVAGDYWPHNTALWVVSFRGNDPRFVYYLYTHIDFARFLSGSGVPTLNRNDVHQHLTPLPPPAEQQTIAAVLLDADQLIGSLEAMIAKKQDIKRAAMQQLLTGRTRLPGFGEEWALAVLGDLTDINNGGTPRTGVPSYWGGRIPWCVPTDITACRGKLLGATARSITPEGLASCGATLLPAGALLLCSRATIGELKIASMPMATNQGFKSLVCGDAVDYNFLYYRIVTLKRRMIDLATGSTFLEISKRDLGSVPINLPPLPEQQAIATVLSDMDAEIAALEHRLDKTRAIKQGMMQQLLTGSIRLPIPSNDREQDDHDA